MAGIVFMKTREMELLRGFYTQQADMSLWLDQGSCIILQQGNMLLGFCQKETADTQGIITFFYPDPGQVDRMHQKLAEYAEHPPRENPDYRIYHFFARDPEGRSLEFQSFMHELPPLAWNRTPLF